MLLPVNNVCKYRLRRFCRWMLVVDVIEVEEGEKKAKMWPKVVINFMECAGARTVCLVFPFPAERAGNL
jgi:hypothetical protein